MLNSKSYQKFSVDRIYSPQRILQNHAIKISTLKSTKFQLLLKCILLKFQRKHDVNSFMFNYSLCGIIREKHSNRLYINISYKNEFQMKTTNARLNIFPLKWIQWKNFHSSIVKVLYKVDKLIIFSDIQLMKWLEGEFLSASFDEKLNMKKIFATRNLKKNV